MKRIFVLLLCFVIMTSLFSLIRTVSLDGTMQFTSIQPAIDASVHGDTVLVYPGRYLENVSFNGKNILLTSLYLYNPSDTLISSTIIDGNHQGSVVSISNRESYDATLNGFTIENGIGTFFNGYRYGGGIYIYKSFGTIMNCIVQNNHADLSGGGIAVCGTSLNPNGAYLTKTTIKNNKAYYGGGLFVSVNSTIQLDPLNVCSVFNNTAGLAHDIYIWKRDLNPAIYLNTLSVPDKNPDYIFVEGEYTLSVQQSTKTFVNHDLYVSPNGNDNNSGLSFAEPLQTISKAMDMIASDSLNPKKVYLAEGVYSRSQNNQFFPINMKKNVSLIGSGASSTIIECETVGGIIALFDNDENCQISGIGFQNAHWNYSSAGVSSGIISYRYQKNLLIQKCNFINIKTISINPISDSYYSFQEDTSITLDSLLFDGFTNRPFGFAFIKNVKINNTIVRNSISGLDADFWISTLVFLNNAGPAWRSKVVMTNILLENCHNSISNWPSTRVASALQIGDYTDIYISNMTVTNNTSIPTGAPFMFTKWSSAVYLYNSIFYGNTTKQIWFGYNDFPQYPNNLYLKNCIIQDGINGIYRENFNGNNIYYDDSNINADPLFSSGADNPFGLTANSPAIDAGTTDTGLLALPETDLAGNPRISGQTIDIGAYEYQQIAVDFSAEPRFGEAPLTVQFNDMSSVNAGSWAWDFNNDGITDSNLQNPQFTYENSGDYSVKLTINNGEGRLVKPSYIHVTTPTDNNSPVINKDMIYAPYPNPFRNDITIKIQNKKEGLVSLEIFNVKGQKVRTLYNQRCKSGRQDLKWDSRDSKGKKVTSGIYTVIMKIDGKVIGSHKICLMK